MLGLAVLFVIALYFTVLISTTCGIGYFARRRLNWPKSVALLLSFIVFCLLTVPVFWDWAPSYMAYKNYCEKEAGVTQYKTLEQWKAENPGVFENLRVYSHEDREERDARQASLFIERNGDRIRVLSMTTPRFGSYAYDEKLPFMITKWTTEFIDEETKEVIAKRVRFKAGSGNVLELGGDSYKIWLNQPFCGDKKYEFKKIRYEFQNITN